MDKIICFGELLLRFSPFDGCFDENYMPVYVGGAELNVCTALSGWNISTKYVSVAPDNYLTKEIVNDIQKRKIDTSSLIISGNRLGIYYLQQGTDLKHAGVIYDRAGSSFYNLKPGEADWDKILEGATWFHFSAISPALNENVAKVCEEGLQAAKRKNIKISVDLNYRAKLWQYGKKPSEIMPQLVNYCDVIMGNLWAAEIMLGIAVPEIINGDPDAEDYAGFAHASAESIIKKFPNCKTVANTFRFDKGNGIHYFATIYRDGHTVKSKEFNSDSIVDKVGSGDCFMAGLIYGSINNYTSEQTINFAAAAAVGKMHEKGDSTKNSVEKINSILKNHE